MTVQEVRKLLESTEDKVDLLVNGDYVCGENEFAGLIRDFFNDEEKLKLFDYPGFMELFMQLGDYVRSEIICLASDDNIIMQMLTNDNIVNGIRTHKIVDIMKKMEDSCKHCQRQI